MMNLFAGKQCGSEEKAGNDKFLRRIAVRKRREKQKMTNLFAGRR
jgi:hypothetical protein